VIKIVLRSNQRKGQQKEVKFIRRKSPLLNLPPKILVHLKILHHLQMILPCHQSLLKIKKKLKMTKLFQMLMLQ